MGRCVVVIGGGVLVHPKDANSMAESGLHVRLRK